MADEQTFPYQAWTLSFSLRPVEHTIVDQVYGSWRKTKGGKEIHTSDLFPTRQTALQEGWRRLECMEAKLKTTTERIAKRRATLTKEGSTND